MRLHTYKFGLAAALTTFFVCVFVALLIVVLPELASMASGDTLLMNTGDIAWPVTLMGFLRGLFFWSICVGLTVWLFAEIYNRL